MIYVFLYIIVGLLLCIATALSEDCEVKERHITAFALAWPVILIVIAVSSIVEIVKE